MVTRHGSLFSGIGGFDLAAEWLGWENIFHCELNPFGQKVLKHYWPNAETFKDITKTDFSKYANRIDILSGGFPCQPYSQAGKRLGKEDERHLWPEMLRAIREIKPGWVVGENVRGLVNWNGGMVFDEVQSELEIEGYKVIPVLLPACAKDAPHRRERVWFMAYNSKGREDNTGRGNAANTNAPGLSCTRERDMETARRDNTISNAGQNGFITNTLHPGLQGGEGEGSPNKERQPGGHFAEHIPNWDNFPTQSPLRSRDDGFSPELAGITVSKHRTESIKAYGNAIVPQVAFEIFKAIEAFNKSSIIW